MAAVVAHTHPAEWKTQEEIGAHLATFHGRRWPHSLPTQWELEQIHRVLHEDGRR